MEFNSNIRIFNLNDFRIFVKSNISALHNRKTSLSEQQILDSVCQFEKPCCEIVGKSSSLYSRQISRNFDLINKPFRVPINTWFLHLFGFKRCYSCKSIKLIDLFYKSKDLWDHCTRECKDCCKQYKEKNKEYILANKKLYYQNNKAKYIEYNAKRKASKLNETPELTLDEKKQIENLKM